jgi:hypothetical protein
LGLTSATIRDQGGELGRESNLYALCLDLLRSPPPQDQQLCDLFFFNEQGPMQADMGVFLMRRSYGNPYVCGYRYRNWHMGQPHKLYASTNHYLIVLFLKIPHYVTCRWIDQINTVLTPTKNNPFCNAWVSDQNSVFGDNCESVILGCTCRLEFVVSKSQGQATLDFTSNPRLTKAVCMNLISRIG